MQVVTRGKGEREREGSAAERSPRKMRTGAAHYPIRRSESRGLRRKTPLLFRDNFLARNGACHTQQYFLPGQPKSRAATCSKANRRPGRSCSVRDDRGNVRAPEPPRCASVARLQTRNDQPPQTTLPSSGARWSLGMRGGRSQVVSHTRRAAVQPLFQRTARARKVYHPPKKNDARR